VNEEDIKISCSIGMSLIVISKRGLSDTVWCSVALINDVDEA
jgi:hypothetical protein